MGIQCLDPMGCPDYCISSRSDTMDRLESAEKPMKSEITECPTCGGELVEKQVEKILKGGNHTATVNVDAQVCLHCGERLYAPETVRRFESIRSK